MKFAKSDAAALAACDRTRDAVARSVLERGPQSAAALAERLGVSPAAIRRHLDALVTDGILVEREPRPSTQRGRGRPARTYALTDTGRASFPHGYDDLASTALQYLRETGGEAAVTAFATHRAQTLGARVAPSIDLTAPLPDRVESLAHALSAHGYASTTAPVGATSTSTSTNGTSTSSATGIGADTTVWGHQVCQHHCPVAHVAAQFPELCEAETRAFAELLGTNVQRLATIAHGDGVCTTCVPTGDPTVDHPGADEAARTSAPSQNPIREDLKI